MRSFWMTAWLLASLLVCSAADPRLAFAGAPAPRPAQPQKDQEHRKTGRDEIRAAIALTGSARAQKIDELSAGWSRRKQLHRDAQSAHDLARAANSQLHRSATQTRAFARTPEIVAILADLPVTLVGWMAFPTADVEPARHPAAVAQAVAWLARAQATRAAPYLA